MKSRQNNTTFLLLLPFVAVTTLLRMAGAVECDPNCDIGSFCGSDATCHPYSCRNYYEFGLSKLIPNRNDQPLECEPIETTILDIGRMALQYRCSDLDPSPIVHGYNHKCKAATPQWEYNCFSIDPSTTSFEPFLRRIDAEPLECPDGEPPFFTYASILEWERPSESYVGFNQARNSTREFDREFAVQGTIYADVTVYPTLLPTSSPTPSPTMESSAAGKNLGLVLVAVACSALRSFLDLI
jgi:hypothetical protein